ncbi:MAG: hypothetical protein IPL92_19680 [Saprospiraceae bacterium]|nr:hypothetical protein [Candidatus Opimibacter iunctus]
MINRAFLEILLLSCICGVASAQRNIKTDMTMLSIEGWNASLKYISYLDPPRPEEDIAVKLYKSYFNPESFSKYRDFFLPSDWGGFTESDFNTWQTYLHENAMTLEKTLYLTDEQGQDFIICHYTVETKEYVLPGAAIFKKVNQGWKHISFMNDPLAMDLKEIGLLQTSLIEAIPEDGKTRSLRSMKSNSAEPIEKFDRKKLFAGVKNVLLSRGVSASDLELSEKLFLEKAEVEMVQYIGQNYQIDSYDLMEELNTTIGFTLFKFVRTLKTK